MEAIILSAPPQTGEAEWEYACRSGGRAETYCGGEAVDRLAWYENNSRGTTHPVGRKQANGLGLYDMSGNVWEWVQDCLHDIYAGAPSDGTAREGADCAQRLFRGGTWNHALRHVRAADRGWDWQAYRFNYLGFRLVRTP